jgi:hypothetical protein
MVPFRRRSFTTWRSLLVHLRLMEYVRKSSHHGISMWKMAFVEIPRRQTRNFSWSNWRRLYLMFVIHRFTAGLQLLQTFLYLTHRPCLLPYPALNSLAIFRNGILTHLSNISTTLAKSPPYLFLLAVLVPPPTRTPWC